MSGKAVGWVFDWADVTNGTELLLLLAIADASHDDGTGCWESIAELAHKTRSSTRWVKLAINHLEAKAQLEVVHRQGRGQVNFYRLIMCNDHGQSLQEAGRKRSGPSLSVKGVPGAPFTTAEKGIERGSKGDRKVHQLDHLFEHEFGADPDPDPISKEKPPIGGKKKTPPALPSRVTLDRTGAVAWAQAHNLGSATPRGIDAELDKFLAHQQGHNWLQPSGLSWADENQAWRKWCLDLLDRAAKEQAPKSLMAGECDPQTGRIKLAL